MAILMKNFLLIRNRKKMIFRYSDLACLILNRLKIYVLTAFCADYCPALQR